MTFRLFTAALALILVAATSADAGCRGGRGGGRFHFFHRGGCGGGSSGGSYSYHERGSFSGGYSCPTGQCYPSAPCGPGNCQPNCSCPANTCPGGVCPVKPAEPIHKPKHEEGVLSPYDAIEVVNHQRRLRGLLPFRRDEGLSQAAYGCAVYRARYRIQGHTHNDFQAVPAGSYATTCGCAAWPDGFGACEVYGNHTYAGAAWVRGADGLNYCHLVVR